MFGRATIRFYGDLADLAWDADRDGMAQVPVDRPRSVKDAVESCGIPHTEVDLVIVNGVSVDFRHLVGAGLRRAGGAARLTACRRDYTRSISSTFAE